MRRLPNEWWFNATNSTNEEAFNKIIEEPAVKAIREIGEITKKISLNVIHFSKEICFKIIFPLIKKVYNKIKNVCQYIKS